MLATCLVECGSQIATSVIFLSVDVPVIISEPVNTLFVDTSSPEFSYYANAILAVFWIPKFELLPIISDIASN